MSLEVTAIANSASSRNCGPARRIDAWRTSGHLVPRPVWARFWVGGGRKHELTINNSNRRGKQVEKTGGNVMKTRFNRREFSLGALAAGTALARAGRPARAQAAP